MDNKSVARDTIQLKRKLDEVLYRLVEQAVEHHITQGAGGETVDKIVDDSAQDIIVPLAHYVRKLLRRHGINADEIMGDPDKKG